MVETEGKEQFPFFFLCRRIPQQITEEKYALGIVTLFPALKDPLFRKGYEHFNDNESGSGFLAWRLKTIQRKTKLVSKEPKMQTRGGGPRQEREIHQDFSLLFGPETSAKLLEKWHTFYKSKVIREAERLTTTPVLQSLLRSARNQHNDDRPEWDSDMASFLLLLHILPPQPTKKKTQKISAAQAMDHLVVFHKSCRNLDEHIENQEGHYQPYLLASGTCKQAISTYYIVIDKKLIPCQGTTSLAAVDELFKVHFVFRVSYDATLNNMYTFLQTTVYGVDVDTTKESPKVKELRAKFMNRS
ncbi:uncharacterized protein [Trachinotus anak]|uniref:uncharacterized protein n=1 Tax=Trachinotus anak TaxID=443729 RepID=UPI0039F1D1A5